MIPPGTHVTSAPTPEVNQGTPVRADNGRESGRCTIAFYGQYIPANIWERQHRCPSSAGS
jgi:hypothetical protein